MTGIGEERYQEALAALKHNRLDRAVKWLFGGGGAVGLIFIALQPLLGDWSVTVSSGGFIFMFLAAYLDLLVRRPRYERALRLLLRREDAKRLIDS